MELVAGARHRHHTLVTWLMAEENFNGNFWGDDQETSEQEGLEDDPAKVLNARYGVPGNWYDWGKFYDRFDISTEPNRFGWMVEVDPSDPSSTQARPRSNAPRSAA